MKTVKLFTAKGTYTNEGSVIDEVSDQKFQVVLKYYKELAEW
jgi:hypothetical protein